MRVVVAAKAAMMAQKTRKGAVTEIVDVANRARV
jgi:hypothetical protein